MGEPSGEAWLKYSGWWLFRKSHFVHLAAKTLRPVGIAISQIGAQRQLIDVKDALANLRENAGRNFVKMVERNGLVLKYENVIPVFALQPEIVFHQAKKFSPLEQNIFREMDAHWQENYVQFKNEARPIVAKYLEESTAKTGSTFIDLTDIYGGVEGDVYTDYCHLTPLGNKKLAEVLGDQVAPQIRNKMEQRRS
jgi:lysophospholipase L1-like esterase